MPAIAYDSLETYLNEVEQSFEKINCENEASKEAYDHIMNVLGQALDTQDVNLFLSLVSYIESDKDISSHKCNSDIIRLYIILHIVELEKKAGIKLFFTDCHTVSDLLEKYILTLFALRRLAFSISDASVNDAVSYLRQTELSVFAIHLIIENDLIRSEIALYEKVINVYSGIWNNHDIRQLLYLIAKRLTNKDDKCHE